MKKAIIAILVLLVGYWIFSGSGEDYFEQGMKARYDEKNHEKANELFEKSCDAGYARGCNALGYSYEYGYGVERDYKKAYKLYEEACDDDEARGCMNIGIMYEDGNGVEQDYKKAIKFYEEGCDLVNLCIK